MYVNFLTVRLCANCALLPVGPNLKVLSTMSVGYDHLALEELKNRSVVLYQCLRFALWPALQYDGFER